MCWKVEFTPFAGEISNLYLDVACRIGQCELRNIQSCGIGHKYSRTRCRCTVERDSFIGISKTGDCHPIYNDGNIIRCLRITVKYVFRRASVACELIDSVHTTDLMVGRRCKYLIRKPCRSPAVIRLGSVGYAFPSGPPIWISLRTRIGNPDNTCTVTSLKFRTGTIPYGKYRFIRIPFDVPACILLSIDEYANHRWRRQCVIYRIPRNKRP